MFSGIIETIGRVETIDQKVGGALLVVRAADYWKGVATGASVAIDGVCLTLVAACGPDAQFDVVPETLRRSTLGGMKPGDPVNLQKSLVVGDRIDGHFVQGHVDAVASVVRIEASDGESKYWFGLAGEAVRSIVPKGSVAVDGISLTVVDVEDDVFSVALIPTTLAKTTLSLKHTLDLVNVETDILARTVLHHLESLDVNRRG